MTDIISNRALYHAKRGNFSGFQVSVPFNITEENLRFLFNNIRDNIEDIQEENTSWFDFHEFLDYAKTYTEPVNILNEVSSMQSRMKMRRAAKRTSKRRARKRFMRRKIRKNKKQLAKRAYSQVKTELRRRLTGGRPWSSVSLATRVRVDAQINKRKSFLDRMVKNRIPKMAGQESKRIQRVRLNSSVEFPTLKNILLEARLKRPRGTDSNDARKFERITALNTVNQRNRRKRINGNLSDFLNTLMVVKNNQGDTLIITKDSFEKSIHEVIQKVGEVTMEKAESITKLSSFDQTQSSQKLFGLVKKERVKTRRKEQVAKKQKQEREEKRDGSMKKSNNKAEAPVPEVIIQPPPPRENGTSIGSLYPDTEHTPENIKLGFIIAFNLVNSGNSANTVLSLLSSAQQSIRSKQVSAIVEPEEKQALTDITKILKDQGLSEEDVNGIIENQTLLPAGFRLAKFLLSNKNITGIGDLSVFYAMNPSTLFIPPIQSYQTLGGNDQSYSADVLFLNKNVLANSLQSKTQISPQKFIEEAINHVTLVGIAMGQTVDAKGKNLLPSKIQEAQRYTEEFTNNNGSLGVLGVSLKSGDDISIRGNIQGDANALIETSLLSANLTPDEKKQFTDLTETIFKDFDKFRIPEKKTNDAGKDVFSSYDSREINLKKTKEKFNKEITQKLNDLIEKTKSIKSSIVLQELTGAYKFGDSIVSSKFIITCSNDGTDGVITEINKDYCDLVASNIIIRVGLQPGVSNTPKEQQIQIEFDAAVDKRAKANKIDKSAASTEITKEIQETRVTLTNKIKDKSAMNMEEAMSIMFDELREQGLTPTQAKQKLYLQEKAYNCSVILESSVVNEGAFKYNSLLRFLIEQPAAKGEENTELSNQQKREYLENAKKWMGDDIYKMLQFCNVSPGIISFSDVNLKDFSNKESNGDVNTLYVHGIRKDIAVEKEVDYDKLMSEHYRNIGRMFLAEAKKRDYKKEYEEFHGKPEERKKRSKRVLARRALAKMGRVHKGDGKDVDHKDGNAMNNSESNLRVMSAHANRAKH